MRPTQSPAPKEGRRREQNRGCQEGGGAAGREHREPSGSALCVLSGRAGGPATCAGAQRLLPCPGLGHPEPPSRPEGGTGSSGPAVLAGASSLAGPLPSAAPARRASQELAGTLFAPWWRRGHARRRGRHRRGMSCPQQHWAPPEVTQESVPGAANWEPGRSWEEWRDDGTRPL